MYIHRSRKFQGKLLTILKHFAKDKVGARENFQIDLDVQIDNIQYAPQPMLSKIKKSLLEIKSISQKF